MEMNEQEGGFVVTEKTEEVKVLEAVKPETAPPDMVIVGGKEVNVVPLKRRWQHIFSQAALPLFKSELSTTEIIQKAISDGTVDFVNISSYLIDGEIEGDNALDRAAAVILASKIWGAEKDVEAAVKGQIEWLADNARTEEMRELVERQADKERLIQSVGERLPARFARSLHLAGKTDATPDMVKQLLSSYFAKLPGQVGNGS